MVRNRFESSGESSRIESCCWEELRRVRKLLDERNTSRNWRVWKIAVADGSERNCPAYMSHVFKDLNCHVRYCIAEIFDDSLMEPCLPFFASCFVQTTNLAYMLEMTSVWTRALGCFKKFFDFVQICPDWSPHHCPGSCFIEISSVWSLKSPIIGGFHRLGRPTRWVPGFILVTSNDYLH